MGTATVLAYGFDGAGVKKLRGICGKLGLRLRRVLPEETGQPVGAFAGHGKFAEAPEPAAQVPGEMLVLCGVTDRQLDALLASLHTARVGQDALKAVLTGTNAQWTGRRLYDELQKERSEMDS